MKVEFLGNIGNTNNYSYLCDSRTDMSSLISPLLVKTIVIRIGCGKCLTVIKYIKVSIYNFYIP